MTFTELVNDLLEGVRNRLKRPYFSSYIIAAIIINWEAILVLIYSSKAIEDRIYYVNSEYLDFYSYLVYPFVSALAFHIVSDFLMWGLEKITVTAVEGRSIIRHDKALKQSIRNTKLNEQKLKEEESLTEYKERNHLNKKIAGLEKELSQARQDIKMFSENSSQQEIADKAFGRLIGKLGINYQSFPKVFPEFGGLSYSEIELMFIGFVNKASDVSIKLPDGVKLTNKLKKYFSYNERDNTYGLTNQGLIALEVYKNIG